MSSQEFTTESLPPQQQFQAWRSWFDPVYDTLPHAPPNSGFAARSAIWQFAGGALARVNAPGLRATRTRALIRRTPVDPWIVTIGSGAVTSLSSRRGEISVPAGTPFIVSLGCEFASERGSDSRMQLYLSRDAFPDLAPALDALNGAPLDGSLGILLAEYLVWLERALPRLSPAERAGLASAVGAMVSACAAPTAERMAAAERHLDLGRMERLRKVVRRNLRSPALTPALLCREAGMSRSQLYRLLESEGGAAHYIRRRRLEESYALLSDPSEQRPVAAIAEELCFADASGFSRAFRHEFGISPSEARIAARSGHAAPKPARAAPGGAEDRIDRWLRAL
ncbi:MAG: helix-turn-helix domain-containing protein [Proteobacteria bacterium]|nr:helix-turn-helix domain-containing protein [Pseudomonadota bacterium]